MNYLGIEPQTVKKTANKLNYLLASYHIYYQNLRNFRNIGGENFFDLHNKFEELYNDAKVKIDEIAERILTLRHKPLSRLSDYMDISQIEEASVLEDDHQMVWSILENHKVLIEQMRDILAEANQTPDEGTIDMIGGFLKELEKKSWMLDAWVTRKGHGVIA